MSEHQKKKKKKPFNVGGLQLASLCVFCFGPKKLERMKKSTVCVVLGKCNGIICSNPQNTVGKHLKMVFHPPYQPEEAAHWTVAKQQNSPVHEAFQ